MKNNEQDTDDLSITTVSSDFGSSLIAEARKRRQNKQADAVVAEIEAIENSVQQNKLTIHQNEKNLSINLRRLEALEKGNFKLHVNTSYGAWRLIVYNDEDLNVW